MKITNLEREPSVEVTGAEVSNVRRQIPIGVADGTPTFSIRVFTVLPNGHTPLHAHDYEHVNYVLRGNGVIVEEDRSERPVGAGDFVLVYPNEVHQYRNASDTEPLVFLCGVPKAFETTLPRSSDS